MSGKTPGDENAADELVQTCPRRMGESGPWKYEEGLDRWKVAQWTRRGERDAERMMEGKLDASRGGARWPQDTVQPRVCSFCGGIGFEDVIRLVESGWEVDSTTKCYKAYLHPPGFHARHKKMLEGLRSGRDPMKALKDVDEDKKYVEPVPPVKLYTQHLDTQQLFEVNRLVAKKRLNW